MGGKVLELESDKLIEQGLELEDWKIKWLQPSKCCKWASIRLRKLQIFLV